MPAAWHPLRWRDWCVTEDDKHLLGIGVCEKNCGSSDHLIS